MGAVETQERPAVDVQFEHARELVIVHDKPSSSWLQRQLGVGYNTAAGYIERMEQEGLLSAPDHVGKRTVLPHAITDVEKLAANLAARGAHVSRGSDGHAQIVIPVELPEAHRTTEVTDDRLRLLIERAERLEEEKKGISDDIRDVFAEAKAVGYDVKIMRQILKLRKMRPDDIREMEMVLDTYKAALGIG